MTTEYCVAYTDTRGVYMDGNVPVMRVGVTKEISHAERSLRIAQMQHSDARIEQRQVTEWEATS